MHMMTQLLSTTMKATMQRNGFVEETTGGGCMAYMLMRESAGEYFLVTDNDGSGMPQWSDEIIVGRYDIESGDSIGQWHFAFSQNAGAQSLGGWQEGVDHHTPAVGAAVPDVILNLMADLNRIDARSRVDTPRPEFKTITVSVEALNLALEGLQQGEEAAHDFDRNLAAEWTEARRQFELAMRPDHDPASVD